MATYLLLHGASSDSWYWHLVTPELRARGHQVVAPDLPVEDEKAGVVEYADVAFAALGDAGHQGGELIVVAQSMAGFVAPLLCERTHVDLLILVAAMVPAPGETMGQWWENTGQRQARREQDVREGRDPDAPMDVREMFFHDVPEPVAAAAFAREERRQSAAPFEGVWPLAAWPAVPTRFLLARDDRCFPAPFQRRVVAERLGLTPDEIDGGHLPALARPAELVERLERFRAEASSGSRA